MNTYLVLFGQSGPAHSAARVFDILLDVSLRGSLLILLAWVATRLLSRASAALRHLIWASALAGMLLIPLFGAITPSIHVGVFPTLPVVPPSLDRSITSANATVQSPPQTTRSSLREVVTPSAAISRDEPPPVVVAAPALDTRQLVALLWAAGAIVLLLRLAGGMLRVSSWTRRALPIDDGHWLTLVHRLAGDLHIARPITLLRSDRACVPMTWGIVYPTVLLPTDADGWGADRRTIVLLHELAHVRRLDAFTQIVVQIAVSTLWFNPLVWLAARHMRTEREHACDDLVLQAGARASDYAHDLLQIARSLGAASAPAAAALAMARRSEIEGRLLAILDPRTNRRSVSRTRLAVASVGVLALALPLAALAPSVRPPSLDTRVTERSAASHGSPALLTGDDHLAPDTTTAKVGQSQPRSQQRTPTLELASSSRDIGQHVDVDALSRTLPVASYAAPADTLTTDSKPTIAVILPAHKRGAATRSPQTPPPDLETLISVARAAGRLTSDNEKADLLVTIAGHYVRSDELRTAYLDAAATITSDYDRHRALLPWLLRDSLPTSAVAQVAKVISKMTSDNLRADLIVKVAGDYPTLALGTRTALIATTTSFTSDYDRGRSIVAIAKTGGLSAAEVSALIAATTPMSSDFEKANALIDLARRYGVVDAGVRKAYFRSAETITSAYDYRRTVSEVLK